jgi:lysine 2,3-aminomutase
VIDAPGGGGKVPIQAETLLAYEKGTAVVRNWADKMYTYIDPVEQE